MTHSKIITAVTAIVALIAVYGAVLSTINLKRDRAKVRLIVRQDKHVVGDPRIQATIRLIELQVINRMRVL